MQLCHPPAPPSFLSSPLPWAGLTAFPASHLCPIRPTGPYTFSTAADWQAL